MHFSVCKRILIKKPEYSIDHSVSVSCTLPENKVSKSYLCLFLQFDTCNWQNTEANIPKGGIVSCVRLCLLNTFSKGPKSLWSAKRKLFSLSHMCYVQFSPWRCCVLPGSGAYTSGAGGEGELPVVGGGAPPPDPWMQGAYKTEDAGEAKGN